MNKNKFYWVKNEWGELDYITDSWNLPNVEAEGLEYEEYHVEGNWGCFYVTTDGVRFDYSVQGYLVAALPTVVKYYPAALVKRLPLFYDDCAGRTRALNRRKFLCWAESTKRIQKIEIPFGEVWFHDGLAKDLDEFLCDFAELGG